MSGFRSRGLGGFNVGGLNIGDSSSPFSLVIRRTLGRIARPVTTLATPATPEAPAAPTGPMAAMAQEPTARVTRASTMLATRDETAPMTGTKKLLGQ